MPRDGAILFGDLIGKLDVLNVACASCSRAGRYPLTRLLADRSRREAGRLARRDHRRLSEETGAQLQRPVRRAVP
jgi:hypothetical protein